MPGKVKKRKHAELSQEEEVDHEPSGESRKAAQRPKKNEPSTQFLKENIARLLGLEPKGATNRADKTSLQTDVENLAKEAPRFLFRAWDSGAGGGFEGLNTLTAVTPHAFLRSNRCQQIPPEFLWDMPKEVVVQMANEHMKGVKKPTVFSSWSQSLVTAIRIAKRRPDRSPPYIAILDTTLLKPENIALFTPSMHSCYPFVSEQHDHEFLIFGVVSGKAYKAVPLGQFEAIWSLPIPENELNFVDPLNDQQRKILNRDILQCNDLFGDRFGWALGCYLWALYPLLSGKDEVEFVRGIIWILSVDPQCIGIEPAKSDDQLHCPKKKKYPLTDTAIRLVNEVVKEIERRYYNGRY